MNDERLFERLASHAGPAEVDEAFGDRLYAVMQREIGRTQPSLGRVLLLVAALVAAATITGAVVVGSGLVDPPWVNRLPISSASAAASAAAEPTATAMPSRRTSVEWMLTGSMITPGRSSGTATLLPDGTVLVAGGTAGSEVLSSAELFDPASRAWAATASMLEDRVGHSATLLPDGTVLVAGGTSRVRPATILESAELYDPATGTWTATGDMIQGRTSHLATLLTDGRVLVVGRGDAINGAVSAELYDPASGTWTATADMSRARDGATATLLPDGRVLVAGGHDDDRLASAELYDPVTGTWTATGELTEAYVAHSATLLLDGTVLVAGGDAPSGPGAIGWPHAEVYDPVTGTWAAVAPMATARLHPTATLLTDGRVLVSGGQVSGGAGSELLPEAEIYDPVTQTWTAIGDMIAARSGHTATLLPDGRVLVVGGLSSDLQTSAELYDPDG